MVLVRLYSLIKYNHKQTQTNWVVQKQPNRFILFNETKPTRLNWFGLDGLIGLVVWVPTPKLVRDYKRLQSTNGIKNEIGRKSKFKIALL